MTTHRPAGDTARVTRIDRTHRAPLRDAGARCRSASGGPAFAGCGGSSILYFAEGFPYGVFLEVWSVYFRAHGVSLKEIGLISLLGLPWTIKSLWAPLVDRYGDRRKWIAGLPRRHGASCSRCIPLFDAAHPGTGVLDGPPPLHARLGDAGHRDRRAHDRVRAEGGGRAPPTGSASSAYRVAMIVSGGGIVFVAGFSAGRRCGVAAGGAPRCCSRRRDPARARGVRCGSSEPRNFFAPLLTGRRGPARRRRSPSCSSTSSATRRSRR